ncbi:MAG: DUF1003 domain-containing protein [Thermoleophilia bacterium]
MSARASGNADKKKQESLLGPAVPERVSRNVALERAQQLTFGQRAADSLARQAGSWRFIFIFAAILVTWITINGFAWIQNWDPYPFILLNLVLSCLAAIQAPVIMMSQNRQEEYDRQKAEADYEVNVKAEKEVERLHLKLDRLNNERVKELLRLQEEQMELLKSLVERQ